MRNVFYRHMMSILGKELFLFFNLRGLCYSDPFINQRRHLWVKLIHFVTLHMDNCICLVEANTTRQYLQTSFAHLNFVLFLWFFDIARSHVQHFYTYMYKKNKKNKIKQDNLAIWMWKVCFVCKSHTFSIKLNPWLRVAWLSELVANLSKDTSASIKMFQHFFQWKSIACGTNFQMCRGLTVKKKTSFMKSLHINFCENWSQSPLKLQAAMNGSL